MSYGGIEIAQHLESEAFRLAEACRQLDNGDISKDKVMKTLLHGNRSFDQADRRAQKIKDERGIPDYFGDQEDIEDYEIEDGDEINQNYSGSEEIEIEEDPHLEDLDEYVEMDEIERNLQIEMQNSNDPLDQISVALDTYRKALKQVEATSELDIDFDREKDLKTYTPESVGPYLDDFQPLNT